MTKQHQERGGTYRVGPDWRVPDISAVLPSGARIEERTVSLSSRYYDTAAGDLRAHGVTLRLRTGGADAGWQVEFPNGATPPEVRLPANGNGRSIPPQLRDLLHGLRGGAVLKPIATLDTTRNVARIIDLAGGLLAEIDDDHVRATTNGSGGPVTEWREVQIELGAADGKLLSAVGKVLAGAGAAPSHSRTDLGHVLGDAPSPEQPAAGAGTLGDLVTTYLHEQYAQLIAGDLALRRDQNVIHQTRVATRRYRSVLRVLADLFDADRAVMLDAELAWYAGLLGAVRDREVMRAHLHNAVARLSPEVVLGPAATTIEEHLLSEQTNAQEALRRQMRGRRYLALLAELKAWNEQPPFTDRAATPAHAVKDYVDQATKSLQKRLSRAHGADVPDEVLHRARKAAKRARYTAELATPILRKPARRIVDRAKNLQEILGEQQDSTIASQVLRQLGAATVARPGENGFTYGVLYAYEQERCSNARKRARNLGWH